MSSPFRRAETVSPVGLAIRGIKTISSIKQYTEFRLKNAATLKSDNSCKSFRNSDLDEEEQ